MCSAPGSRSAIPSEMPATWPIESLKAQAIAARSFVLFRKEARANLNAEYDVESDVMDQVFKTPLGDDPQAIELPIPCLILQSARQPIHAVLTLNSSGS